MDSNPNESYLAEMKKIFENVNDLIITTDSQGIIRSVNNKIKEILGHHPDKVIGLHINSLCGKLDTEALFEVKTKHMNGNNVYLEVSSTLIDGGILCVARDITERKLSERAIKSSRDQLNNIINSASDLIFSVNRQNTVTNWNRSLGTFSGINLINRSLDEIQVGPYSDMVKIVNESIKQNECLMKVLEFKDLNGSTRKILSSTSLIKSSEEEVLGVIFIGKDVTSRFALTNSTHKGYINLINDFEIEEIEQLVKGWEEYNCILISRNESIDPLIGRSISMNSGFNSNDEILSLIESEIRRQKTLIILGRLDYLITLHGSNKVIQLLYQLNDLIYNTEHIILLRLNQDALDPIDFAKIRNECRILLKPKEKIYLDPQKIEVLKYILNKNQLHINVHSEIIRSEFRVSKRTIKEWIDELTIKGLVTTKRYGRKKLVHITDKGRSLI